MFGPLNYTFLCHICKKTARRRYSGKNPICPIHQIEMGCVNPSRAADEKHKKHRKNKVTRGQ